MSAGAPGAGLERARWRSLVLGLVVLVGFLFVAALVLGWSARVAQACDPVTRVGCDTTSSTAASGPQPPSATLAPAQGGTQSPAAPPADNGQPFIPPGAQVTPTAPPTTVAPATPTTAAAPTGQSSGSSGDFPWDWVLGGGGAALATTAVVTGVAVSKGNKVDPLADFNRACEGLCFAKEQQAQAEADIEAAQAELTQIDQAYFKALDYLDNQLRQSYLAQRRIHAGATLTLYALPMAYAAPFGLGPVVAGASATAGGASRWGVQAQGNEAFWNAQVNAEMKSAHGEIDRIHDQNRAPWQAKLDDAKRRQNDCYNAVVENDLRLAQLRADNPNVTFPACACE